VALAPLKLIVGLGNPGKNYEFTRHNLGFLVLKRLAEKFNLTFTASSFTNGLVAEGVYESIPVCLLAPLTYMNHSGVAVDQLVREKSIAPEDILVICDDVHLDFEQMRLRAKGGDGGHNGLDSIIQKLGTQAFARLRMGVGRPHGSKDMSEYVLEKFTKKEFALLDSFIDEAVFCSLVWLRDGVHIAMDQYNTKK